MSVLKIRFALSASFLVLLLLLACLPRAGFAQEESVGEAGDRARAVDRALSILKNVVGLDVDAYRRSIRVYLKDLFRDILPKETVGFDFEAYESQLEVYVRFVDGKLQSINIYVKKGVPLMVHVVQQAANEVDAAKSLLSRYQAHCGATHVEAFKAILDTVEHKTNTTKVYENIKFEAEYTKSSSARFAWIYTFNSAVSSSRWVAINVENGYTVDLIDNWNLFKIGSCDINVDEAKAIEIAMNAAKNYSYKVYMGHDTWITVSDFKIVGAKAVALMFSNSLWKQDARDGDPLTEYPTWFIEVYFDKYYPGGVCGLDVSIWADTGEIREIVTMSSSLGYTPPSEESGGESGDQTGKGESGQTGEGQTGGEDQAGEENEEGQVPIVPDDASKNGAGLNVIHIALIALHITIGMALATVKVYSKWKSKSIKGS
ncbi:MAG: hypothetical protein ACPLKQ_03475 [Candidatus Bathyarchaeales archaeon]